MAKFGFAGAPTSSAGECGQGLANGSQRKSYDGCDLNLKGSQRLRNIGLVNEHFLLFVLPAFRRHAKTKPFSSAVSRKSWRT